jgi:hypothetical protein
MTAWSPPFPTQASDLQNVKGIERRLTYATMPDKFGGNIVTTKGFRSPVRLLSWWAFDTTNHPRAADYNAMETPFAFWVYLMYTRKDLAGEDQQWELIPGRKIWPTRKVWSIALEYDGRSLSNDRNLFKGDMAILWRWRMIYKSSAVGTDMPDVVMRHFLEW